MSILWILAPTASGYMCSMSNQMQFVLSIDESIIIDYGSLTANGIRGDIFYATWWIHIAVRTF